MLIIAVLKVAKRKRFPNVACSNHVSVTSMERTIPYQCNIIYYEINFMCYLGRITGPDFEVELVVVLVLIFYQYLVNEVPLDGGLYLRFLDPPPFF